MSILTLAGVIGSLFFMAVGLYWGFSGTLNLAIDIAAKLEPKPKHNDQFQAYKARVSTISWHLSGAFTLFAMMIVFVR